MFIQIRSKGESFTTCFTAKRFLDGQYLLVLAAMKDEDSSGAL